MRKSRSHSGTMRMSRGSTMDELRAPKFTWGQELQGYETEKRRVVDERFCAGSPVRVTAGVVKQQERVFDPLLQRYRDGGTELQQRTLEEKERVGHLNRAQDIHILRATPFNIIDHTSKLEAIAPGQDPERLGRKMQGNPGNKMPDTACDHNLISNMPFDLHHWAPPGQRPHCIERSAATRVVPAYMVKDFNIVNNRYVDDHDMKTRSNNRDNLLDATRKYNNRNRFDPVVQQYTDPRHEERARTCDDAHDVEVVRRAHAQVPPSIKCRESAGYDVVSHHVHNPSHIQTYDTASSERKTRFKNRYIVEHNLHVQDVKGDHTTSARALGRIAPERFEESNRRGFNIVSHQKHAHGAEKYGHGHGAQTVYAAYPQERQTPWERATSQGASSASHTAPGRFMGGSAGGGGRPRSSSGSRARCG